MKKLNKKYLERINEKYSKLDHEDFEKIFEIKTLKNKDIKFYLDKNTYFLFSPSDYVNYVEFHHGKKAILEGCQNDLNSNIYSWFAQVWEFIY